MVLKGGNHLAVAIKEGDQLGVGRSIKDPDIGLCHNVRVQVYYLFRFRSAMLNELR